jgi:acyl-coenzyme A synthetase/AMP-(fatty) acid ligase
MSAGEPLNPQVISTWKESTGLEIYDHYGQTETVCVVANFRCMPIKPGAMGLPVPGYQVDVVDDDGKLVPDMHEGHIALRCTSLIFDESFSSLFYELANYENL